MQGKGWKREDGLSAGVWAGAPMVIGSDHPPFGLDRVEIRPRVEACESLLDDGVISRSIRGVGCVRRRERTRSQKRRKSMKTFLVVSVVAMAAAMGAPSYAADQPTIPVIVKDTTSGYWQIVFAGARQAAKDLHVNVPELGAQSEADINGEITILENAVAQKPAAIVIAPTQFKALGAPIDEAAKKVPIIGIDSAADSKAFTSFLTTDNKKGGRIAADGMAEAIKAKYGKDEGEVALITHLPGVGSLQARDNGFQEELKEKYPGLKLVAHKISDGNATTGLNIMTDLITAYPNLRGVFADNLIQCQGASQAVAENKKGDTIKLVCFDADDKLIGYLKSGVITALLLQDPYRMGYDGVKTALAASKGEKVQANVDTGANLVTKANMDNPKEHKLLYPPK
jgi:ribose transport system substrate-binding protein